MKYLVVLLVIVALALTGAKSVSNNVQSDSTHFIMADSLTDSVVVYGEN